MIATEVACVDLIITCDILVVEDDIVGTETVGQLQAVGSLPLILQVQANLVVAHGAGRIADAIIAIGERYCIGRLHVEEVVHALETVVTRTVTQIRVVGIDMLEAGTGSELMRTHVEGEVVRDVGSLGLHTVVV